MGSKWLLTFSFALLCGCAGSTGHEDKGEISDFKISLNQNLLLKQDSLSGTGRLVFTQPLLGINSNEHFRLNFRFPSKDSEIILHSHFSGFDLEDGVKIKFFTDGTDVFVKISSPGYPYTAGYRLFNFLVNDQIQLELDVHDGVGSGVEVFIWNNLVSYQGERVQKRDRLYRGNAAFDSRVQALSFLSSGRGMRWGLELKNVDLFKAQRQAALID